MTVNVTKDKVMSELDYSKYKTVRNLPFTKLIVDSLNENPVVSDAYQSLLLDFENAYTNLLNNPVQVTDEGNFNYWCDYKTEIFRAFIMGAIWSQNPMGNYAKHIARGKEPKSNLILPGR